MQRLIFAQETVFRIARPEHHMNVRIRQRRKQSGGFRAAFQAEKHNDFVIDPIEWRVALHDFLRRHDSREIQAVPGM